jgi:hypothetical protein
MSSVGCFLPRNNLAPRIAGPFSLRAHRKIRRDGIHCRYCAGVHWRSACQRVGQDVLCPAPRDRHPEGLRRRHLCHRYRGPPGAYADQKTGSAPPLQQALGPRRPVEWTMPIEVPPRQSAAEAPLEAAHAEAAAHRLHARPPSTCTVLSSGPRATRRSSRRPRRSSCSMKLTMLAGISASGGRSVPRHRISGRQRRFGLPRLVSIEVGEH